MIIIQISNSIVHSYLFLTGSLYKEYVVHWRCEEMFLKNVQWMTVYFLLIIKPECGDGELQIKFLFDKKKSIKYFYCHIQRKKNKHNMVNSINHALEKSVQLLCLQQIFNIVPKDECFCIQVWFSSKLMIQTVVHF